MQDASAARIDVAFQLLSDAESNDHRATDDDLCAPQVRVIFPLTQSVTFPRDLKAVFMDTADPGNVPTLRNATWLTNSLLFSERRPGLRAAQRPSVQFSLECGASVGPPLVRLRSTINSICAATDITPWPLVSFVLVRGTQVSLWLPPRLLIRDAGPEKS